MNEALLSIAGTALLAVIGWLYNSYRSTVRGQARHLDKVDEALKGVEDRTLVIETRIAKSEPSLEAVQRQQVADGLRLASTEGAIAQIREAVKTMDARQLEISEKLDQIPRLNSTLENFAVVCQQIVPRPEHEARWHALDQRLDGIIHSIREIRTVEPKR